VRKEITSLYNEVINPGRKRKPNIIIDEILENLKERSSSLQEYCSSRLGSRVMQACLKWGSKEQRLQLLGTLKDDLAKLACDRFGHVVVLKLLRYCSRISSQRKPSDEEKKLEKENLKILLAPFRGKALHSAFYHKNGCRVINGFYFSDAISNLEKRRMLHEVAVPAPVALMRPQAPGSNTLRQLLHDKDLQADHRTQIISNLREVAERAVDKELLGFEIVHILFQAYCEEANEDQLKDLAEKCMDGAPHLLSSKSGAEALLRLLGVVSAKHRRNFCKELKGKFCALATNAVDYLVTMRLAMTVDDTVMLGKTMLTEFTSDFSPICFDKYGHKVIAWIFQPDDPHVFSPYERRCLALPAPSSVKQPDTRRQELVRVLRPQLRTLLTSEALKVAGDLNAKNVLIAYLASDWDVDVVEALVAACEQEAKIDDLGQLDNGTVTTTLISLLSVEPDSAEPALSTLLWRSCFKSRLERVAVSRCAFVLRALLKCKNTTSGTALRTLQEQRKALEAAVKRAEASGLPVSAGKALLEASKKT